MGHGSDDDTNCKWCTSYSHERVDKGIGRLGNQMQDGDHPDYNQNTEKVQETCCHLNSCGRA